MQFIDQAPAYTAKSMSLAKAIENGRAMVALEPGGEKVAACFQPRLDAANEFDREINNRVNFNALPTPEKLDLMIDELLPRFFCADKFAKTGRDRWIVSFLIDGSVLRSLEIDADGVRAIENPNLPPAFALETDIMTLMAILRSVIADYHRNNLNPEAL